MHRPRLDPQPRTLTTFFVVICIAASCSVAEDRAEAQLSFQQLIVDPSGPQDIWGKAVGDLNQDGLPDLIAGGQSGGGLVWYENPTWTKRTIAAGGSFSTDHEVCDVDGDGDNDVVSLSSSLSWYEAPSWFEHVIAGTTLHDIEVLDFEGDGDCDIVGRNQGSFGGSGATLYFYAQIAPDSWSQVTRSVPEGEGLASADIDGDGDLDVVVNEVWIENRGANLAAWVQHTYTNAWSHGDAYVAIEDIDSDGNLDIVLSPAELQGETNRISWFEAPNDPAQVDWVEHVVDASVEAVHHFVGAGDFDSDGDTDIATAEMQQGSNPDEIKIYRNDGGAFSKVVIATGGSHSMRVVDIDLDGDLDLFGANWQSNEVDLFINETPRNLLSLDAWERHVLDANRPGTAIFIAADDLDGDELVDVAAGGYWYRNPGSPDGAWARAAFGSPLNNLAVLHDFDGDGDTDVLGTEGFGSENAPDFVFGRNDGQGSFSRFTGVGSGSGDFLQGVAVARLAPSEPKRVFLSWHAGASAVEALVVPSSPASQAWPLDTFAVSSQQEALSHGDIDRDGDQDLLLGTVWLENYGPDFSQRLLHPTSDPPDRNRLADIDGDGRLDAVVGYEAISTTGVVAWYRQPSDPGGLWSETVIAQVTGPMSLDVADMDRDGDLDVVVGEHDLSNPGSAGLYVFENVDGEGGTWAQHTVHVGDEHHDGAQLVDIDSDGDLDIVSIGWGHSRVLLYENRATMGGGTSGSGGAGGSGGSAGAGASGGTVAQSLVGAWGFEETSGSLVKDTSGRGRHGILENGAVRAFNGRFGQALETNGVTGNVEFTGIDVAGNEMTLMAWINADDFGVADARILSKSTGSAEQDHVWMLSTVNGTTLRFRLRTNGATSTLVGESGTLSSGDWIHVAATYDGTTMRLFQNGTLVGIASKSGEIDTDSAIATWLGANPGQTGQVFDGRIDEVKVYRRALTAEEISSEMFNPVPPSPLDYDYDCSAGPMGERELQGSLWLLFVLGLFWVGRRRSDRT